MKTIVRSCAVLLVVLSAATACRSQKPPRIVVARVGNQAIYLDEVDKGIAADLFDLRSEVLHKLVANAVLQGEAARRGMSLNDLWRVEVDQKVPKPSGAEAIKTVDQWVSDGKITVADATKLGPENASLRVRDARLQEREQHYFDGLYDKASVQLDFGALGKPWMQIANDGPSLGPADAPITVVEFADLTKSFVSIWQPTLEKLVAKYDGKVRFLFKQKPPTADSPSAKVAEATLCADDQKRYWEFRKALFHDGKPIGPESLSVAATAARLDVNRFEACLSSGEKRQKVAQNVQEAAENKLLGEPVLSLNGIRMSGAQPFDMVDRLLRNEISTL